jgi:CrcB protein
MNPLALVLVGLAGGLGAVTRFQLDALIRARFPGRAFPWSTATINVTGSFALGLILGLSADSQWALVAGTGFLGGYTTFSTASVEAIQLAREGRWGPATASAAGVLVAGVAAAAAGLWLGGSI